MTSTTRYPQELRERAVRGCSQTRSRSANGPRGKAAAAPGPCLVVHDGPAPGGDIRAGGQPAASIPPRNARLPERLHAQPVRAGLSRAAATASWPGTSNDSVHSPRGL